MWCCVDHQPAPMTPILAFRTSRPPRSNPSAPIGGECNMHAGGCQRTRADHSERRDGSRINFTDTSVYYGRSEEFIGKYISNRVAPPRVNRGRASKAPPPGRRGLTRRSSTIYGRKARAAPRSSCGGPTRPFAAGGISGDQSSPGCNRREAGVGIVIPHSQSTQNPLLEYPG